MVDARTVAGWITGPDGKRTVCPRCEGEAFIRVDGVSQYTCMATLIEADPCPLDALWCQHPKSVSATLILLFARIHISVDALMLGALKYQTC